MGETNINTEKEIKARVTNIVLDKYILKPLESNEIVNENTLIEASSRGNIRRVSNILVGDIVVVEKAYDKYMIESIEKRRNSLIRPPVSNIDVLVIILSLDMPVPDYILLDKELVLCSLKNIKPIIVLNKIDLANSNEELKEHLKYINNVYGTQNIDIVNTSVKDNLGIDKLKTLLKGQIAAFSGNSGVGKSSVIKEIIKDLSIDIGEISKKTNKGRHKTKHVKLYDLDDDTYILDTPGFSSYELMGIDSKELKNYYLDFLKYNCNYEDCLHIKEGIDVCEIKRQVENKNIDEKRYERYVYIYNELKEKESRKYK